MKKLIWFLLCGLAFAQTNNARMLNGVNKVTQSVYTFAPVDATRVTSFSNPNPVTAFLPSGLNAGFGAGIVFSVQNLGAGTVTITCTSCTISSTGAPAAFLTLTPGAGADIYGDGQNYTAQTGSGSGGGSGLVSAVFGRIGAVTASATDYGGVGILQVGTGNVGVRKTAGGTLDLGGTYPGPSQNYLHFYPDNTGGAQILLQDYSGDQFAMHQLVGFPAQGIANSSGMFWNPNAGSQLGFNHTDYWLTVSGSTGPGALVFDFNGTASNFYNPVNFAGTGAFQINGSFGVAGQCLLSSGTGVGFGACASGTVSSVSGTVNQVLSTGGGTPVMSLASPLTFPGNLNATQLANGDDLFTMTRKTDTLPTGRFFNIKSAGGSTISSWDIAGNGTFTTLTTTDATFAGHIGFTQGPDFSGSCPANSVCHQAPAAVGTAYTVTEPAAGPSGVSVKTSTALAGGNTTESYVSVTGGTSRIASAAASVTSAANNNLLCADGSGNVKDCGVSSATVLGSIQGPGAPYTNSASNVASTAYTYSTSIPASTTVLIVCSGTYKIATAVNTPEFGLNFANAPTTLFESVFIGINATTQTGTFGRTSTNGALITAAAQTASFGTYYPFRIEAGVTTNLATTFTIQAAQVNNTGSSVVTIDQSSITCSVK